MQFPHSIGVPPSVREQSPEIVRSVFHVSHDTVSIRDIGGDIACGNEVGVYTYRITKNIMKLMFVKDSCEGRAHALIGREWVRAKK